MDKLFHNNPTTETEKLASKQRHITIVILGLLVVFNLVVSSLGLLSFLADYNETQQAKQSADLAVETAEGVRELVKNNESRLEEAYRKIEEIVHGEAEFINRAAEDRHAIIHKKLDRILAELEGRTDEN